LVIRLGFDPNSRPSLNVSDDMPFARNRFISIDVSDNTKLTVLEVSWNLLESLDVSKNTQLTRLDVGNNELDEIDVTGAKELRQLWVRSNNLDEIDVLQNPELRVLDVADNNLTEIDVSENPLLWEFRINNNNLTRLDVSENENLLLLFAHGNSIAREDISAIREANLVPNRDERFGFTYTSDRNFYLPVERGRSNLFFESVDEIIFLRVEIVIDFMPVSFDPWFSLANPSCHANPRGELEIRFNGHEYFELKHLVERFTVVGKLSDAWFQDDFDLVSIGDHPEPWFGYNIIFSLIDLNQKDIRLELDFTSPCEICDAKLCVCPCESCEERPCVCLCICRFCADCINRRPLPDLSNVGLGYEDGKIVLTNISEILESHDLTFRWYRRIGEGDWVHLEDVPADQHWVTIELDTIYDVAYKCVIVYNGRDRLVRENSYPPQPLPNFWRDFVIWAVVGILAITGGLFIIVSLNKRDPSLKKEKGEKPKKEKKEKPKKEKKEKPKKEKPAEPTTSA